MMYVEPPSPLPYRGCGPQQEVNWIYDLDRIIFDPHHMERRSYFGVIGVIPNRAIARKKSLVYQ